MRRRLTAACALLLLTAAVRAAEQYVRAWQWVAPEGEEFSVLMPEVNFRIRREVSFGARRAPRPVSYEVTDRGVIFSVLSFPKSGPHAPKSLDDLAEGVGRGLSASERRDAVSFAFARDVGLEGRGGREFTLRRGAWAGTARAYEGAEHFYLVLGFGHPSGAASIKRFQESFSFDRGGLTRVPAGEAVEFLRRPLPAPSPLWPLAGPAPAVFGARSPSPDASALADDVLVGKAFKQVAPVYPSIAKAARAQGTVAVQVTVDEEGYVVAASPVGGHPLLQPAAALCLRQWRFTQTVLAGQPAKVTGTVNVNFVLK